MSKPQAKAAALDPAALDALIAGRIQAMRQEKQMSLSALALASGVSKAMISRIERAESSPTAMTLGRLAASLGVTLSELVAQDAPEPQRLRLSSDQAVWVDPELGYTRRIVAPYDASTGTELIEVDMPRGTKVSYPRWEQKPYLQRLWAVEGSVRVGYGAESYDLSAGDSLDFSVDKPVSFQALGGKRCKYLLVLIDRRAPA